MTHHATDGEKGRKPREIPAAPPELTSGKLQRLGEGIGKVVYASPHWVVARDRSPSEIAALIVLWKVLRKLQRVLPGGIAARLLQRPSSALRVLRRFTQAVISVAPKNLWFTPEIRAIWRVYQKRSLRGERLAQARLVGTALIPERITFPPTCVRIDGWPRRLTVTEAAERVEATLFDRLNSLGKAGRFDEVEQWLDRFLALRPMAWQLGLFSVDAHLKNFGVCGERILLLDTGGLTNRWADIEERLAFEEVVGQPHIQLGLGPVLGARPDIAQRFDERWRMLVNRDVIGDHWPGKPA